MVKVEHTFDPKTYRHKINGHEFVLHCHHYLSLATKLAGDFDSIGGTRILRETMEDCIYPVLDDYLKTQGVTGDNERLAVGLEYYSIMGLGKLAVEGGTSGGTVTILRSHVDQGWIKKWGTSDKSVNHVTCGYVAAMFSAAFGRPPRSYRVTEMESMATGAERGVLTVEAV